VHKYAMNQYKPMLLFLAPIMVAGALFFARSRHRGKTTIGARLPPGPKYFPLLGSVISINTEDPSVTFVKWAREYGDIVYCNLFGTKTVILSTEEVARELLDKRSKIYSDRAGFEAVADYGAMLSSGVIPYGPTWRLHRRLYNDFLRPAAIPSFHPCQLEKVSELMHKLSSTPLDFYRHFESYSVGVIANSVYNRSLKTEEQHLVERVGKESRHFDMIASNAFILALNAFPFLRYLPPWFFGGKFNAKAHQAAADAIVKELYRESDVEYLLSHARKECDRREAEEIVKCICYTSFLGSDTTTITLSNFVLAMLKNPDAQARAHAELDAAIGRDRLPTFEDRSYLPYTEAISRETRRWHPSTPLGLPHRLMEDDIFNGYLIPKGSIVIAHTGAIAQDERRYSSPAFFKPERFYNADGKTLNEDTVSYAFGFGRRMCPGRHLADATSWIAIASILSMFKIEHVRDENGNIIEFEEQWESGLNIHLKPFPCQFVPRSSV